MANAFIAYRNRVDAATLSYGSWVNTATITLNNLKDRVLAKPARSTDAANSSTRIRVDLGAPRRIKVLALCRHNLTTDANYRFRCYSDAGYTNLIYDSGTLPVWAALFDSLTLEWEDSNFWSGTLAEEDRTGYAWNLIHLIPESTLAYQQYWQLEFFDASNSAGYIQAGRLFMADGWTPTINMQYGAGIGYESRTGIVEASDGSEYFDEKVSFRVAQFQLDHMAVEEAMTRAFDMQRISGIDKEVLFVYDRADQAYLPQRSFLGRLRKLSPIEQPNFSEFGTTYEIKELL